MTSNDSYQILARQLSFRQWEMLAEHFQSPRPMTLNQDSLETRTRQALLARKLLRKFPYNAITATHTTLTEEGHGVMCAALGMMADMLVSCGYDGISNPRPKPKPMEKYAYGKLVTSAPDPVNVGDSPFDKPAGYTSGYQSG